MKFIHELWPPNAYRFKVGGFHLIDPIAGAALEQYKKPAGYKVNPPKAVGAPPPTPSAELQADARKKSRAAMIASGSPGAFYDNQA